MNMLDLALLLLGSSVAALFVVAILVCTIGGAAVYLREFALSVYRQLPRAHGLK